MPEFYRLASGSTFLEISRRDFVSIIVPRPEPDEQRRIAEMLDAVDAAIQRTDTLINKLKWMKAGLLNDLLTRGLDRDGRLRDPVRHPEQFESKLPFGSIPTEWNVDEVGNLFDMQLGKMLSKAARRGNHPCPYLANRNVQWDYVDLSNLELMDFSETEKKKFSLLPGDLLVCEGGEVGRTSMWRGEADDCFFQKAIHRLRPKSRDILPGYMLRFMRFAVTCGLLTSFSSQTSIAHLTREKLALLPVPVPKRNEQIKIIEIFDKHDAYIQKAQANRDKLISTKHGLMHDLLTGRVRVPATKPEVVLV